MKRLLFRSILLAGLAGTGNHAQSAHAQVPYADCEQFAQKASTNLQTGARETQDAEMKSIANISKHATCFAQFEPGVSSSVLMRFLAEGFNNSKQQSSPTGSAAASSAVAKPAGSTSLIQDVGGFSATNNGSSFTLQFAPGDLVNQLAGAGAFQYCTAWIHSKGCVSPQLLEVLSRATFSVTTNTSTTGAQVSGTAQSSGAAVPAKLSTTGNTLTFGGLAAKYVVKYVKKSDSQASPTADPAGALATKMNLLSKDLDDHCSAYKGWKPDITLEKFGNQFDKDTVLAFILRQYGELETKMKSDPTCASHMKALGDVVAGVSAYQAALAAQQAMSNSSVPMLGLEYDFTTPASKPSYHTLKFNFTMQGQPSCASQVATADAKAVKLAGASGSVRAVSGGDKCGGSLPGGDQTNTAANPAAPSPNWTVSASGGADFYNTDQSATIPSASRLRDIQIGGEITRVWHLSNFKDPSRLNEFLASIGDLSLVGAYYYQDQTSPGILNGPPSSITFSGLPTTASQVFATRGPINVGQVRLGFGTGKNVTFPVAVSYSNRSDLIVHPFFGVQFGISYDLFGK